MVTPRGKLCFLVDCTVNIDPSPDRMTETAARAAWVAREFDVEPRVALLSFSNFGSSAHPAVVKGSGSRPSRAGTPPKSMDGEMQADTAVVREIVDETYPFSAVKGGANILIFSNLDAGNIAYKLLSRLGEAQVMFYSGAPLSMTSSTWPQSRRSRRSSRVRGEKARRHG